MEELKNSFYYSEGKLYWKEGKVLANITSATFIIQEGGVFEGNKRMKVSLIEKGLKKEIKGTLLSDTVTPFRSSNPLTSQTRSKTNSAIITL